MTRLSPPALGLFALALALAAAPVRWRMSPRPRTRMAAAAHGPSGVDYVSATPEPITGHGAPGHGSNEQPNILEPQAPLAIWTVVVFGDPAPDPRPVRVEADDEGAPRARGAHRALPARGRAGPQRGRAAPGREPEEHGQGRRAGPRHDRVRQEGGRGDRRTASSRRPRPRPRRPGAGRARHRHGPRPGARRDLHQDGRPGRRGRRQGALEDPRPPTISAGWPTRRWPSCPATANGRQGGRR